jgi:SAM-dependent methyltransferase
MEAYPRLFARFKLRFDPLFSELDQMITISRPVKTVMDIGCGYGIPASRILEQFPQSVIYGIEPDAERVRIASAALGERGKIFCAAAPHLPEIPEKADLGLLLDVIHFISDEDLNLTLERLNRCMSSGALLLIRAVIPPLGKGSRMWRWDRLKMNYAGIRGYYRSVAQIEQMIGQNGFVVDKTQVSVNNEESVWIIGRMTE